MQEQTMALLRLLAIAAIAMPLAAVTGHADTEAQQGSGKAGSWAARVAVKPDPSKVIVPANYKVGVFAAGLDTPSAATVDADGNVWVAISGPHFMQGTEPAHVKVFSKTGTVLKEIGKGTFTTVLNQIGYCAENKKIYIPEFGEKIWEIDGVNGELKLIVKDLFIGDHRNGGITCKDGYL
jgi:hypothetical protein